MTKILVQNLTDGNNLGPKATHFISSNYKQLIQPSRERSTQLSIIIVVMAILEAF